jgi:hypothetical protein
MGKKREREEEVGHVAIYAEQREREERENERDRKGQQPRLALSIHKTQKKMCIREREIDRER